MGVVEESKNGLRYNFSVLWEKIIYTSTLLSACLNGVMGVQ